jgi:autotransporter-associated beta strand protein
MRAFSGRDLRRLFLASTALVLPLAGAHAQNATWQAVPTVAGPVAATFDFNANANWVPATVPTGTATFAATTGPSLSFSALSTTLGTFQFNAGAPAYTFNFDINGPQARSLTFTGAGIVNNSANAPTFTSPGFASFATVTFQNASTAANSNFILRDNTLIFQNTSSAGTAIVTMPDSMHPGIVEFHNTSTAANANITVTNSTGSGEGTVTFFDASTAGNATIVNNPGVAPFGGGGTTTFGIVGGSDSSNAGTAHITNNDSGTTNFLANSSAVSATITNNSGGNTNFQDQSSAANATITNNSGGTLSFAIGAPTAGNATIINMAGGLVEFGLNGLYPIIIDTATAGNATITNSGMVTFSSVTTAGNAIITTNSGASVSFFEASTGGNARFITNAGGTFDMSGITTSGISAGSIEGAGNYFLGSRNLSVGGNNLSTTVSGVISDGGASGGTGGSLTHTGTGTLTLTNANTYTGGTFLNGGTLGIGNNQAFGTGAVAMATFTALRAAGNGFNVANAISLAGADTVDTNGFGLTLSGIISGSGSPTITGGGTLTLTNANTYTGGTFLNAGALAIGNSQALGTGALTMANFTTLRAAANGLDVGNNIALNGTGTVNTNGFGLTLSGIIADGASAGSLTQTGAGTLTLTRINSYTGATDIGSGTLALVGNGSIANSAAVFTGPGTFDISQTNSGASINSLFGGPSVVALGGRTLTLTNNSPFGGSIFGGVIRDGGIGGGAGGGVTIASGETNLQNTNTYTGPTTINPGAQLTLSSNSFPPLFSFDGSISSSSHVIDNGTFDISHLSNGGTSIRSLGGNGVVGLGANTLTLTTASDTFAGSINGRGGLSLAGGTQTLTGANTYSGPTTVNAGALYVNGSIVSASTVNTGATLGGSGTVGPVTIAGGTLAPGSQNAIGTLSVNGPLGFSANSFYNVRISPAVNDQTVATGAVTPGGATVNVIAGAGIYTTGRRTIVTAASVNGTFNPVVQTNLAFLHPMLAYDTTHVYLDITGNAPNGVDYRVAAQTYNQLRVATGLTFAGFGNPGGVGGVIVTALNNLSNAQAPGVFDSLSGAGIAAAQNVAFDASRLFTSAMSDQGRYWLEGGPDMNGITVTGPASFYASVKKGPFDVAALPSPPPPRTWRAWFTGFGEGETVHGELPLGTARQDNSIYGGAGGLDYQLFPNTLIGIAAGGSSARFSVPSLATSGTVDGGHIGTYGVTSLGPFYAQSSSTFSLFRNHETRNIGPFGGLPGEMQRGDFNSHEVRSRLELGRKFISMDFAVTPFVAMEIAKLWSDGFIESGGILGLTLPGSTHVSAPAFLGARAEKAFVLSNGWVFTPTVSAAWVHEFSPVRDLFAGLTFLPASTFVIDGARPASNSAQVKTGAKLALNPWAAVYANFEGEFSNKSQTYAGKGGVKVSW